MSEEMNKEAEVQEEAVDIPVTDGSEEEAADTAQAAEEEASDDTAAPEETEQQPEEAESQKEPETKTKTSFFGKKKKEKEKGRKIGRISQKRDSFILIFNASFIIYNMPNSFTSGKRKFISVHII